MSDQTPQPDDCLFCAMADGRIRPHLVHEDSGLMAMLDIGPIRRGHVMVVPRIHAPYFEDLPADLAGEVVALGQRIAKVQKRLYGVERVGFMFTGGDVPHAHAHVVPMVEKTDVTSRQYIKERTLTFAPIPSPDSSELESVASEIRDMLRRF